MELDFELVEKKCINKAILIVNMINFGFVPNKKIVCDFESTIILNHFSNIINDENLTNDNKNNILEMYNKLIIYDQ